MGSNKNNLKRTKRDDVFDTSFDDPKPFQFVAAPPKPGRLITCPNCKLGEYCEFLTEGYGLGYCLSCAMEIREPWDKMAFLTPELVSDVQARKYTRAKTY